MRRRRLRIVQLMREDDRAKLNVQPQNRAATASAPESAAPVWLRPSQQHLLDLQQQMGNQSAMRALGVVVQRAPKDLGPEGDEKDPAKQRQDDTLSEMVDTSEEVEGINDQADPGSLFAAAVAAYKSKKYGTALIAFRELFSMSQSPAMLINMAICELRLDLFHEAQADLQTVLETEDLTQADRARAIGAMDSARKLNDTHAVGFLTLPSNVDTESSPLAKEPRAIRHVINSLYRTAESAAKSEDYDAAYNAFRVAQERLPNPVTLINIGKILVMQQRYSEASAMFEKALRDKTLTSGPRKVAEAELEASKRFQGLRFDAMGDAPTPPS